MKKVFFIHWNEEELKEKVSPLQKAGYTVTCHHSQGTPANLKEDLPDVLVICLDRLPSHGRAYAAWLWEAKKRQHIPIVFCGGLPDKADATRAAFPKAIFCTNEKLLATLDKLK